MSVKSKAEKCQRVTGFLTGQIAIRSSEAEILMGVNESFVDYEIEDLDMYVVRTLKELRDRELVKPERKRLSFTYEEVVFDCKFEGFKDNGDKFNLYFKGKHSGNIMEAMDWTISEEYEGEYNV